MGIRERKEREKEQRRNTIMKAAAEVINKHGFPATSLDLIAEKAELSRGTIYFYFKTREELYGSVLLKWINDWINDLDKTSDPERPIIDVLKDIGELYLDYYVQYPQYFKLFAYLHQGDMQFEMSPELLEKFSQTGIKGLKIAQKVIQRGIDEGLFYDVDPWETAKVIWGAMSGITLLYGNYSNPKANLDEFRSVFFWFQKLLSLSMDKKKQGKKKTSKK